MHTQQTLMLLLVAIFSQSLAAVPSAPDSYIKCKAQIKEFKNGVIDAEIKDFYNVNDRVWFECNEPYVIEGVKDVTCLPSGKWDYPPPTCVEKSCLIREAPLRGNQNPVQEKYQSGTKVDYFCNKNHKLEGSPFAICIGNEEWSHPVPTCKAQTCNRPDDPANGNVLSLPNRNQQLFNPNDEIWFECDDGFDRNGIEDFFCQSDGTWKPQPFPTCVLRAQTCNRPDDPANGNVLSLPDRNQLLFNLNDEIWFECDDGFDRNGIEDFFCQSDGTWRPQPFPTCVQRAQRCNRPDDPANGKVISLPDPKQQLFDLKEEIWFKCNAGFVLDGIEDFFCQKDGNWKPQPFPRCVRQAQRCDRPKNPANGNVLSLPDRNQQLFKPDEEIWFKCNDGFILRGIEDFFCQKDGNWKPQPFPKCVRRAETCNRPDNPANGNVISLPDGNQQLFKPNEEIWFKCDAGFVLEGTEDFFCQRDGNWRPQPFPRCVRRATLTRKCERPGDPANGYVISKPNNKQKIFNPREEVWFKCDNGYDLIGTKDFVCQRNGNWRPQPFPKCIRKGHNPPPSSCPDNGWTSWIDSNNPIGRCDCELLSNLRRHNQADVCEKPTGIQARNIRTKKLYNSNLPNVKISPEYGFACWHTRTYRCEDYEVRFCCPKQETKCRRPRNPLNGDVVIKTKNSLLFNPGQTISFKCDNGYTLVGARDLTCQRNGDWRPQPFPTCVRQQSSSCSRGGSWTSWFDDDNQQGKCDCERLSSLRRNHQICERPTNIEARVKGTNVIYNSRQRNIKISPTYGFVCWNTQQSPCKNYEVRFCCPSKATSTQRTAVACENDFSKYLRCPRGSKIQIVKGFYGRNNRQTCPSKSIRTEKCLAKNSLEKLRRHCNNKYSCRLSPSNKVFGDPCRGTFKYIEVTYFCRKH